MLSDKYKRIFQLVVTRQDWTFTPQQRPAFGPLLLLFTDKVNITKNRAD